MNRPAYQEAMWRALLAGFYIPEMMDCYFRYEGFAVPHLFIMDYGY